MSHRESSEPNRSSAVIRAELSVVERAHRKAVNALQELEGRRKFTQAEATRIDHLDVEVRRGRRTAEVERTTQHAALLRAELQEAQSRETACAGAATLEACRRIHDQCDEPWLIAATWLISITGDGISFRRLHEGAVVEAYGVVDARKAAVYAAAIVSGFQPPRGLLDPDTPTG